MNVFIDREEANLVFKGLPQIGGWKSTTGKKVLVFPPSRGNRKTESSWTVIVPEPREVQSFEGQNAEERAFLTAARITQRKV